MNVVGQRTITMPTEHVPSRSIPYHNEIYHVPGGTPIHPPGVTHVSLSSKQHAQQLHRQKRCQKEEYYCNLECNCPPTHLTNLALLCHTCSKRSTGETCFDSTQTDTGTDRHTHTRYIHRRRHRINICDQLLSNGILPSIQTQATAIQAQCAKYIVSYNA